MRFLHTSDWHLGVSLNQYSMIEEQRHFIEEILQTVDRERIEAVVVAGDIFDHAVSNPDAIHLYNYAMTQLCIRRGIPVIICAGNHDGAARLSSCSELLREAGLYIAGSVKDGVMKVQFGDTVFYSLPFFSIDEARYLYPKEEIKNYDMAMKAILRHLPKENGKSVLVAHCFVSGAEVSESDRSAMIGGSNRIGADAFQGFDYVALGHLHKPQDIANTIRYSGSPMKLSFSEAAQEKSVTIIDTVDFSRRTVPLIMKNDLRVEKGTYEQLWELAQKDPRSGDYVKIELTDEYAHMELNHAFREYYPRLLSFSGKSFEGESEDALSMQQTAGMTPEEIMVRFYKEFSGGEEPDGMQMEWFRKAVAANKGGDAQ